MSMMRCATHDVTWDSDIADDCPLCCGNADDDGMPDDLALLGIRVGPADPEIEALLFELGY